MYISLREGRYQDYTTSDEGTQLLQLISTELKLIGFKMNIANYIPLEIMKKFVETHPNLQVFHITTSPKTNEVVVRRMLNGNWQLCVLVDGQMVFAGSYDEYEQLMKESMRERANRKGKEIDDDDDDDY